MTYVSAHKLLRSGGLDVRAGCSVNEVASQLGIDPTIIRHIADHGRIYLVSRRDAVWWRIDVVDPWDPYDLPEYRFDATDSRHAIDVARGWAAIAAENGTRSMVVIAA